MLVMRAYQHKFLFTARQDQQAAQFAGCARLIYNAGLEQRIIGYQIFKRGLTYNKQAAYLKEIRASKDYQFLKEAPFHVLQQALMDLDQAYQNYFAGRAKFPCFKKRGQNDSFRYPDPDPKQIGAHHPSRQNQVRLPKLGWIKIQNCYPRLGTKLFEGQLKFVTVTRKADGWYASFTCQVEIADPVAPAGPAVGLDLGVVNSVATSEGELIHLPVATAREKEKLIILQQRVSSKQLRSKNKFKAQQRFNKCQQKIVRRKKDAQHKLTTQLARKHSIIVVEKLNVKKMTQAEGAAKKNLNSAILQQSWGELIRQLEYKTEWSGTQLIKINPAYTSQKCNLCSNISQQNRKNQAFFVCQCCGHQDHADINAAKNILAHFSSSRVGLRQSFKTSTRTGGTPDPSFSEENAWTVIPGRTNCKISSGTKIVCS